MKIDVKQGQSITVIDIEGGQVVDFFAEASGNANEFLSTGVTIDCNESLKLNVGNIIYTNLYHPMMQVISDDVGEHDLFHPYCRQEMYDFFYHNGEGHPNCFDNINHVLEERRAIISPVNLFMHTKINSDGSISVEEPLSKAGDKITLKALMDTTFGVALYSSDGAVKSNSKIVNGIPIESACCLSSSIPISCIAILEPSFFIVVNSACTSYIPDCKAL